MVGTKCCVPLEGTDHFSLDFSEYLKVWRLEPDLEDQTHWVCRDGGGIRVRWVCRCRWQGLECSPEEGESGPSPHCREDPSWRRRDGGGADQVLVARAALAGGLFIPKATWTRAGELTR